MVLTRLSKIRLNVTLDLPMHVLHYFQETGKTMLINGGCPRETSWPIREHSGNHVISIRMTSALWEWKWWIKITVMSKIEWNLWNDHLINLWLARRKSGRILQSSKILQWTNEHLHSSFVLNTEISRDENSDLTGGKDCVTRYLDKSVILQVILRQ